MMMKKPILLLLLPFVILHFSFLAPGKTWTFNKELTMELTDEKGKTTQMVFYVDAASGVFAMKSLGMAQMDLILIDETCASTTFMTMGDKKVKMQVDQAMMNAMKGSIEEKKTEMEPGSFTKTGRSKTISGYTAYEYKAVQESRQVIVWMAELDFELNTTCSMAMAGSPVDIADGAKWGKNHLMLEMESTEKNKTMKVKISIANTSFSFDDSGYENVSIPK